MPDYPESISDLLDDQMKFKPAVLRALRTFRRSKPWRGSLEERMDKFRRLHQDLADSYGLTPPQLVFEDIDGGDSGASSFNPSTNTIVMRGKLSVVTFLHEWGHRLFGRSEKKCCRWSINLYRRSFPVSFRRAQFEGHMVRVPLARQ